MADGGFRVNGVYLYGLYGVAVFTDRRGADIDVLDLLLKRRYVKDIVTN